MRKIVETIFDLFFQRDIDENGNEMENPEGDDSYSSKIFGLILLLIVIVFTFFALR